MRIHPKYIQLIGDAVIPVAGFFFWHWSLYFILLFYFLDIVTKEVVQHAKSKKIIDFNTSQNQRIENEKTDWIKWGGISFVLLILTGLFVQLSMPFIQSNFDAQRQIVHFWTYKDMGIEQGYFLVPLVVFMGYSTYKMEFLAPAIYAKITVKQVWKSHLNGMIGLVCFAAISFGLVHFIVPPEWLFVVGIVIISSVYQLIILNRMSTKF